MFSMDDVSREQFGSQKLRKPKGKPKGKFVKKIMFKLKSPLKNFYMSSSRSGDIEFSLSTASTGTLYENSLRNELLKRESKNDLPVVAERITEQDLRNDSTTCEKPLEPYNEPYSTTELRTSNNMLERHCSKLSLPESTYSSTRVSSQRSLLGSGYFRARFTGFSGDKSQTLGSLIHSKFYSLRTRNVSESRCSDKTQETELLNISPVLKEGQDKADSNQSANQTQIERSETKSVYSKDNDSTSVQNIPDDKQNSFIRKKGALNLSCDDVADIKKSGVEGNVDNKSTKEKSLLSPLVPKNEAINDMMRCVYDKLDFLVDQRTKESKVLWPYIPYPECQDMLMDSFSCAWSKELMTTGRLYITPCWMLFFAHFLTKGPRVVIPMIKIKDIKRCDILMLPTALEIVTDNDCYKFVSFVRRDKCYMKAKKVVEANIKYVEERKIPREVAVERITKYTESRFRTGTINDMFAYDDNLILRKSQSIHNYSSSENPLAYHSSLEKNSNLRKRLNKVLISSRIGNYISSRKKWDAFVNTTRDINAKLDYGYGEIRGSISNLWRCLIGAAGSFTGRDFAAHTIFFMLIIFCATTWLNRILEREISETLMSLNIHPKVESL